MTTKYFNGLNYTLGNEDTAFEIELIKKHKPQKVFAICGSGGRSLPLCHEKSTHLTLADLSKEQLYLAELRAYTYKYLSYTEFLIFWGYFPYADNDHGYKRKELFIKLNLPSHLYAFFSQVLHETNNQSFLYLGKWERTFDVLAKINKVILGKDYDRIMHFDNLEEQRYYYKNLFPMKRWNVLLHLVGNKAFFNALLYKGDFIKKNSALSHFEYYKNAYERLFLNDLASKSFFLHLCFFGKISSLEGLPAEALEENFNQIKKWRGVISYANEDFVAHLASGNHKYDFLSLSDVPSYFSGSLEKDFMQKIKSGLNPGAIIVIRNYLRIPESDLHGFKDESSDYQDLISLEKVQMYDIRVYRYLF